MIRIRAYRDSDRDALLSLIRELQAAEAALYDRMKPAGDMGDWYIELLQSQCREEDGAILVAENETDVIGYATIRSRVVEAGAEDEVAYVYAYVGDLVVTKGARGRGAGQALLAECERRARAAGRDELRITVLAANTRARDVYRACGFDDLLIDMRKKLS
jgi:ribosomal protein S18 acetylase RimI-like enzyme